MNQLLQKIGRMTCGQLLIGSLLANAALLFLFVFTVALAFNGPPPACPGELEEKSAAINH